MYNANNGAMSIIYLQFCNFAKMDVFGFLSGIFG